MDDAEINKYTSLLNNIVNEIYKQLKVTDIKIKEQDVIIQIEKEQLINVTKQVVELESKMNLKKKEIEKVDENNEMINSEKEDIENEIEELEMEIDNLKSEIESQDNSLDWQDVFEHIFNPIGTAISDVISDLLSSVKENQRQINNKKNEIKEKENQITKLQNDQYELDNQLVNLESEMNNLIGNQKVKVNNITELGIQKTNTENFKLKLEDFENRSKLLLDKSNNEKDLINCGIPTQTENIIYDLKNLYISNGLTFNI